MSMETFRVVAYVALAGLAPVILLTVVMLRGVVSRRPHDVAVPETVPAAEPQRASSAM
jgi:hypothetical protein